MGMIYEFELTVMTQLPKESSILLLRTQKCENHEQKIKKNKKNEHGEKEGKNDNGIKK